MQVRIILKAGESVVDESGPHLGRKDARGKGEERSTHIDVGMPTDLDEQRSVAPVISEVRPSGGPDVVGY